MNYKACKILFKLQRSFIALKSNVEHDDIYNQLSQYEQQFRPFVVPWMLKSLSFSSMVITGKSGSGKSTFLKKLSNNINYSKYDNTKAIVSNFSSFQEASSKLMAVGLNSMPTWCKPRNVLSVGQGFRADIALNLKDNMCFDEFTSTVDRNVAKSACVSISKYIQKNNLKNMIFVSCHKDFIPYLNPDIVIDLDDECIYDCRDVDLHESMKFQIYESKNKNIWNRFKEHHYLTGTFNNCATIYLIYYEEQCIGIRAVIPFQTGNFKNAWFGHRTVILPDYQGMGIGTKFMQYIGQYYIDDNKKFFFRSTHLRLKHHCTNSLKWRQTTHRNAKRKELSGYIDRHNRKYDSQRIASSFQYVGDDFNTKAHQIIICDGDCDENKAIDALNQIIDKDKYIIIVSGNANMNYFNIWEKTAYKNKWRTEILYINYKKGIKAVINNYINEEVYLISVNDVCKSYEDKLKHIVKKIDIKQNDIKQNILTQQELF